MLPCCRYFSALTDFPDMYSQFDVSSLQQEPWISLMQFTVGDGPQMNNNRCSKCIYKKIECTYEQPLHVRLPVCSIAVKLMFLQKLFYPAR